MFALSLCALVFSLVQSALAKQLPKPIRDEIQASRVACDGSLHSRPKFVSTMAFNRDRRPDYLLNYQHVRCGNSAEGFCGSGGCLHQLFVSQNDGSYAKVLDKNLLRIRFGTVGGRRSVTLDLHGSECGKVGVAECREVLVWDGNSLRKQP
jgi:hypothetical protein